ncbi:hypothetical protein BCR33DRAFT_721548 [Rhizoclosmatium globosum]|uniref:Low temperature requirement A n=1 Tax=Rhizoclosmatium globosum TaxID=329046 RepID=A0A1Y2BR10_9FUNG|nr:hypothetical protein BCR33DRAFT_721548 [Rhizoclosmatium globosum]|eukprot:ORY37181.1 hypothetical protein BCR33DRAFT_721548 [Rhizoclosmatium globosum]
MLRQRTKQSDASASTTAPPRKVKFDYPAIHSPMVARDRHEENRNTTAIELLFDLTIVVGVSNISSNFAASLVRGDDVGNLSFSFLVGVLALWLSWLPYVWFCSGFHTDDALFRIGTLGQMAGVLVIVNGMTGVFTGQDYSETVIGFIIARVFYIGVQDPPREFELEIAGFTFLLQCIGMGWAVASAVVVGSLEFLAPVVAVLETTMRHLPSSPHFRSIRRLDCYYFGEGILSISNATKLALNGGSLNMESIKVGLAGLIILFVLWWMYFLVPYGALLHHNPKASWIFGYLHFFSHAALILVSSALGMAAEITGLHAETSHSTDSTETTQASESTGPSLSLLEFQALICTAIGMSIYLMNQNLMNTILVGFIPRHLAVKGVVSLTTLLIAAFGSRVMSVGDALLVMCAPLIILLIFTMIEGGKLFEDYIGKESEEDSVELCTWLHLLDKD